MWLDYQPNLMNIHINTIKNVLPSLLLLYLKSYFYILESGPIVMHIVCSWKLHMICTPKSIFAYQYLLFLFGVLFIGIFMRLRLAELAPLFTQGYQTYCLNRCGVLMLRLDAQQQTPIVMYTPHCVNSSAFKGKCQTMTENTLSAYFHMQY